MQIYLILEEFMNRYPQGLKNYMEKKIQNDDEDYFVKPNNLRELLLPEHLMPFLMQYLKDMKNESIEKHILLQYLLNLSYNFLLMHIATSIFFRLSQATAYPFSSSILLRYLPTVPDPPAISTVSIFLFLNRFFKVVNIVALFC